MIRLIIIVFLSFNICAAKLVIESNPTESDVFVIDKNGIKNGIGKTPFTAEMAELTTNYSENGPVQIEISKAGFEKYSVAVPNLKDSDVIINANLEIEKDMKFAQDFDFLMGDLFDVLRMIRGKDLITAMDKLQQLEVKFPHFSIIHEMKGSVAYLQKDFTKALNFYRKSFGLNPKNREAYRMKMYLEKKFGVMNKVEGK